MIKQSPKTELRIFLEEVKIFLVKTELEVDINKKLGFGKWRRMRKLSHES